VDAGSNRGPSDTYRRRFNGCKCGCGIEAFNYGRSSKGAKSWDAFSDNRGGQTSVKAVRVFHLRSVAIPCDTRGLTPAGRTPQYKRAAKRNGPSAGCALRPSYFSLSPGSRRSAAATVPKQSYLARWRCSFLTTGFEIFCLTRLRTRRAKRVTRLSSASAVPNVCPFARDQTPERGRGSMPA
jgi:hypothetical protein